MWGIQPGSANARRDVVNSSVFTPAAIAGLQAWFKADTLALNNDDPVTTWLDNSVNGRNATQATAGFKPLYKTNQQNGLPGVLFDGTDDYLATVAFTLNQPLTIFAVLKLPTAVISDYIWDGSANNACALFQSTAGSGRMFAGTNGPTIALGTTNFRLLTCRYNGAASIFALDGAVDVTGDVGATNMGQISLGVRGNKAGAWTNVIFCEFLVYNAVLSGADEARVKTYLNAKYVLF